METLMNIQIMPFEMFHYKVYCYHINIETNNNVLNGQSTLLTVELRLRCKSYCDLDIFQVFDE